ncbi:MAG: DUF4382 domain-containing protein [archaeon]|nr:DUF4382 domain-containing protein [archaeon]
MQTKILIGLLIIFFVFGCTQTTINNPPTNGTNTGRVVFAITDAAVDMQSVTSVKVVIDSVRVHSEADGWITVSSTPQTFDLLELKAQGQQALLADTQLKEGTYNQLRLDISSVIVTDENGDHSAKLPSGELKINTDLIVKADSTSTANFDFIADESLHTTGQAEYVMTPVVQCETRSNAQVTVQSNSTIQINGGKVDSNIKIGMDVTGNVGVNNIVPSNANVSVVGDVITIIG